MKKLNLKVEIAPGSGFCFGVTKAIKRAEDELNSGYTVYSLGEIVHNDEEIERLAAKGLKTISHDEFAGLKNSRVLFRAHGEPPESYLLALRNDNDVIDASCPIILKLQEKIQMSYAAGERIYIFGKHNHPEIIGLNGKINNHATVFEDISELNLSGLPKSITLYSQTTKGLRQFHDVIDILKEAGIEVQVHDTVCRHVSNREDKLSAFASSMDVIVFVSGKNSSNGRQLFEICRNANPHSYFITKASEVNTTWFRNDERAGVCGATSTPLWLIEEVKLHLESL
jgi:4-hydroxy-3-methylbut-2-en-1-yl diphosphate reductase